MKICLILKQFLRVDSLASLAIIIDVTYPLKDQSGVDFAPCQLCYDLDVGDSFSLLCVELAILGQPAQTFLPLAVGSIKFVISKSVLHLVILYFVKLHHTLCKLKAAFFDRCYLRRTPRHRKLTRKLNRGQEGASKSDAACRVVASQARAELRKVAQVHC